MPAAGVRVIAACGSFASRPCVDALQSRPAAAEAVQSQHVVSRQALMHARVPACMSMPWVLASVEDFTAGSCTCREGLPAFKPVELRLEDLVAEGRRLAQEQEHVNKFKLSEEYMRNANKGGAAPSLVGFGG